MSHSINDLCMFAVLLGPLGALMLLTGLARLRSNACAACGYSLRGLKPGARCPECGGQWPVREGPEVARSPLLIVLGCVLMVLGAAPIVVGMLWGR